MNSKPWVAYVGPFRFPDGGAASRRILGNALSIYESGYDVKIISGQKKNEIKMDFPDFLDVFSVEERTAENLPQFLKRAVYFFMGRKTYNWFNSQNTKPNYIILYSGYTPYILWMMYYSKKHKIPLFFDAVEWYQQSTLLKNLLSPYQWNIEIAMRFLLPKLDGLIVISDYLLQIYRRKIKKIVKIPPTLNIKKISPRYTPKKTSILTIAYTGTPGIKDSLNEIFEAISYINSEKQFVMLNLAGMTDSELFNYNFFKNNEKKIPRYIKIYGKLLHSDAVDLVRNSDFSILVRKKNKVSSAGFSTKMVESLSVGTPLIANITGDMGSYLSDGINSILCSGTDRENIISALKRAIHLSLHDHKNMRCYARKTAESAFDYQQYIEKFKNELFL